MVANGKGCRKKDLFDAYARTDNAAATCGAEGTAGADNGKGSRKKDPVDAYARTDNAAATCGAEGTAGADGLDLCVTRCEATRFKSPRKGACYMLCSLAVAPCANG